MGSLHVDYPIHPAAALFPLMSGAELQALADDIKAHGLHEKIVLCTGPTGELMLLDGRHRLQACRMAGVEPELSTYSGDDPVGFALSANLTRRHLNESQRAAIAVRAKRLLEASANVHSEDLAARVAKELKVSRRSVFVAQKVLDHGVPQLVDAVTSGAVKVSAAAAVAELPVDEQVKVVADGVQAVKTVAKKKRVAKAEPLGDREPAPVSALDLLVVVAHELLWCQVAEDKPGAEGCPHCDQAPRHVVLFAQSRLGKLLDAAVKALPPGALSSACEAARQGGIDPGSLSSLLEHLQRMPKTRRQP